MGEGYIAWDIGGAHTKVAYLNPQGIFDWMTQTDCPMWKGITELGHSFARISAEFPIRDTNATHIATMTGELTDYFANRSTGVKQISAKISGCLGIDLWFYKNDKGFINHTDVIAYHQAVASANWHASATFIAEQLTQGILIDIGSTTTDIIPFRDGKVIANGNDDQQRLMHNELVYSGVTRTPIMAIDDHFALNGKEQKIVAEMFATTADLYRILGLLPEHIDLYPTCDGRSKSKIASAKRLARMFGCDYDDNFEVWFDSAQGIATRQQDKIAQAIRVVAKTAGCASDAPLISAGTGHFIVPTIAATLGRECYPFAWFVPQLSTRHKDQATEYATVLSLAHLAEKYLPS